MSQSRRGFMRLIFGAAVAGTAGMATGMGAGTSESPSLSVPYPSAPRQVVNLPTASFHCNGVVHLARANTIWVYDDNGVCHVSRVEKVEHHA